jgi:hypothetical protein
MGNNVAVVVEAVGNKCKRALHCARGNGYVTLLGNLAAGQDCARDQEGPISWCLSATFSPESNNERIVLRLADH